jgi:phosphoribosylformylglycinamidine synthase
MRNSHVQFRCQWTNLRVETTAIPLTSIAKAGQVLRVPISHGEGNYFADPETIAELESGGRVAFRYCTPEGDVTEDANPNGSLGNIAGIVNRRGNVMGMMPHPERCCEELIGGSDGAVVFESIVAAALARVGELGPAS